MSVKDHPNINAAGLTVDVIKSIKKYTRNNAEGKPFPESVRRLIIEFGVNVSTALDEEFGTDINSPRFNTHLVK